MDQAIFRLGVALAIGLLVGLERGWRERDEPAGSRTAGIRTFGLSGLLGGVLALLAESLAAPHILAAGLLAFALIFGWFQAREAEHDETFSVTGVVAGLAVFALGALAVAGDFRIAAAGGAGLAAVLASREVLHGLLKRMSWVELRSALMLAAMTAIVLPLLPDRAIDPWGGFNPREIWLFTVLTAAISYAGYVAVRVLGPERGFLVSGLAGAVVSSTAVTVAFARAAKSGGDEESLAGGAALAGAVSILRVLAVIAVLRPSMLAPVAPAALAAALAFVAGGILLVARRRDSAPGSGVTRNPFDLVPLAVFALAFAAVSTASAVLVARFGSASLVASSTFSGIFDVDVGVLSALRLADQTVAPTVVAHAILGALAANACGRLLLAASAGPARYFLPLGAISVAAVAAGAGLYFANP